MAQRKLYDNWPEVVNLLVLCNVYAHLNISPQYSKQWKRSESETPKKYCVLILMHFPISSFQFVCCGCLSNSPHPPSQPWYTASQGDLYLGEHAENPKKPTVETPRNSWNAFRELLSFKLITNSNHMQSKLRFFTLLPPSPLYRLFVCLLARAMARWGCRLSINHQIKNY